MTRVLVQRGSGSSSSNSNRPPPLQSHQPASQAASSSSKDEEQEREVLQDPGGQDDVSDELAFSEDKTVKCDELVIEGLQSILIGDGSGDSNKGKSCDDDAIDNVVPVRDSGIPRMLERLDSNDKVGSGIVTGVSHPPPPPVPPKLPVNSGSRRPASGGSNSVRIGSSRRSSWQVVSNRSSPSDSRPSSPRSYGEGEGYNSADEQNPCYASSYYDIERERLFEVDIRRAKGLEVRRMVEDGNCLFRGIADQVYGDPELYDTTRQMCIDYMERERDHFSQFITESFTSYCKRKRRDKVYGNNVEIQAFAEMYNRPIHIYSYSTEPFNIFHGNYNTDSPPMRLSYHHGNHYNSLVDPRRLTVGAGLGFSSLRGSNIDKDQVKAAIKAQQNQQIDDALVAEGRFFSDLELTEKEMERMVMEASMTEYLADHKTRLRVCLRESSTSGAEPSSSGATTGPSQMGTTELGREKAAASLAGSVLSSSIQVVLSMGFSYLQAIEAYSVFGDDVDSMVCYLLEMGDGASPSAPSRSKGKAAE